MHTLFLGSIGTLAETSELQREAFNAAFAAERLDWHWGPEAYAEMLARSGGADRIARYAERRGESVDADRLHARKSELFQGLLRSREVALRPGVQAAIDHVTGQGGRLALVTATSRANVVEILEAVGLEADLFDLIVHRELIARAKPAPDAYHYALETLGVAAGNVLAVEDNPDGVAAARAAGITCLAFPGALHAASPFPETAAQQSTLDVTGFLALSGRSAA